MNDFPTSTTVIKGSQENIKWANTVHNTHTNVMQQAVGKWALYCEISCTNIFRLKSWLLFFADIPPGNKGVPARGKRWV